MAFITLDQVKQHLRILTTDEDALLTLYMNAACDWVANLTGNATANDSPLVVAALLTVADLYENREAQSVAPLSENKTVMRLLAPYLAV